MAPYEILIVVFTVIAIIVGLLVELIKKMTAPLVKLRSFVTNLLR